MINLENISFDHCLKCTVCTIYCPVAKATSHYPGPKQSGPDSERLRIKNPKIFDTSLKYCNNCKRCEIACPSDVKIADIISAAKNKFMANKIQISRLRDFMLSSTDLMGGFSTLMAPVVNYFTKNDFVKYLLDHLLKISDKRTFPNYEYKTFRHWFKKQKKAQINFSNKIVYFHGCYVNYNDHNLGKQAVCLLNHFGYGVSLTKEKCCGVPLIANGFFKTAKKNAKKNISVLTKATYETNLKILSTSSSCSLAIKHEYPNLLELDNSKISDKIEYITKFFYNHLEKNKTVKLKPVEITVAYHSPCHLERLGGVIYTLSLLKKIPGLNLKILHSECCGISGTYGFKKEFYNVSQTIGKNLFEKIDAITPDFVVTDCETCKWQIEMSTKYKVVHPVNILYTSIFS